MSKKILLQTILKLSDKIKTGDANFIDVAADYFSATGDFLDDPLKAVALSEINKIAPSNVKTLEGVDINETILPTGLKEEVDKTNELMDFFKKEIDRQRGLSKELQKKKGPNVQKAGEMSDTAFTDKVMKDRNVQLTGRESFGELMEKLGRGNTINKEGIGSLFPKGKGAAFEKFDDRDEVAEFIRNMRGAGIKNPDIRGVFKEFGTDIEGGKRAATTLARAADMGADTKAKQELLSEFDEMKMDKGPRFFQEEYMGYDDFRSAVDAKKIEVNNAIVDDLEKMGVEDDTIMFIMGRAREINRKPFYTSGEEFVDIIKEELEFQGVDYNVDFYKKYFRELESLMRKPEPRFMFGGVV
jgi:hypothetical protein